MRPMRLILIPILALGVGALADDQGDRHKLIGSWELRSPVENMPAASWTFSAAGNSMRIKQLEGGSTIADFACETEGTPCEIKSGGKRAMASLWFNGPRLVELETKGTDVVKRRFTFLPASDSMEMEIVHVVPSGKTETFEFKRVQLASR